jgi:hypothetical protein
MNEEILTNPTYQILILLAILWQLPWTSTLPPPSRLRRAPGVALWKSARNNQLVWFVVLFLVNTLAILEILYLAFLKGKEV